MEYVRILHLAATTMEATVDSALSLLLEAGESFDYAEVRDLAQPKVPKFPALTLSGKLPDLKIYGRLLEVSLAAAGVLRMTDASVIQDRRPAVQPIQLPTVGAQSVTRLLRRRPRRRPAHFRGGAGAGS